MSTLWEIEAEFIRLIAGIKRKGIKIDREFCLSKIKQGEAILANIRSQLSWNPGSPKQLGEFLLDEMGYPVVRRTEKGNPSFDKFALEEYELMLEADGSDIAQKVLRYRGWQKTTSSNYKAYIKLADKNDILHPNYKVHGTVTGRTSCENPNLQQIPRESIKEWNGDVKKAFISRGDTVLVEFDFGQLETRLAAAAANETQLLEAFRDGVDVFQVMADTLHWDRQDAKLFTYMTLYGAGVRKVALIFKVDRHEAKSMVDQFFDSYPNLKEKAQIAQAVAKGQGYIEYWTGRRRHFKSGDEYRKAFNAYIQGGAFEIIKRAGIRLQQQIDWPMVLTVHDSYVIELPVAEYTEENCNRIKSILESVPESGMMDVPFSVGHKKWGE